MSGMKMTQPHFGALVATFVLLTHASACSSSEQSQAAATVADFTPGEDMPGGEGTNTLLFGQNALSRAASNANQTSELAFYSGNAFFRESWVEAPSSTEARDGLGPFFNARSCASCHFLDGRGRPPETAEEPLEGLLFRLSRGSDENGMPLNDPVYGGQIQPFAISGVQPEGGISINYQEIDGEYPDGTRFTLLKPEYTLDALAYGEMSGDTTLSPRVAPAMIGLGLLEAIPEERLRELEDPNDNDGDGISGRVRWVPAVNQAEAAVGRFGWKCEQPSVKQQSAGALLGDMGLTTSLFPEENCTTREVDCLEQVNGGTPEVSDEILDRIATYSRLLAVPARSGADREEVLAGKALFLSSGCAACHTTQHKTGEHELAELSRQNIFPYTDLLLHDMGEDLADADGSTPILREWRTPPLWALRFYPIVNGHDHLLHDGRARGVEEAILWHDGEAKTSRDAFMALEAKERTLLISFVNSL